MARKKRKEDPDDHNRWIVSYADFITLLFALFAVMYSMSSLNEEKYAAISNSMMDAFSRLPLTLQTNASKAGKISTPFKPFVNPEDLVTHNQEFEGTDDLWSAPLFPAPSFKFPTAWLGDEILQEGQKPDTLPPPPAPTTDNAPTPATDTQPPVPAAPTPELIEQLKRDLAKEEMNRVKEEIAKTARDIRAALGAMIQGGNVTVTESTRGVSIEINASILFAPGKAKLNAESIRVLSTIAGVLVDGSHKIEVAGYTDSIAVHNNLFPSNWELSAHRAATVAHLFTEKGIAGDRLTAMGRAENAPIDTNDTAAGRAHNRRVIVSILPSKELNFSEPLAP